MNIQGQFIGDEERAARRLIEQAGIIIKSARGDMPESFAPLLFAGVSPEDLVRYEARELAELAEAAWTVPAGAQARRAEDANSNRAPVRSARSASRSVTIIELINSDMPFLLDSVMAELTEQGVDVRLVLHPVFTVERDQSAR